jgi:hypothetical protein
MAAVWLGRAQRCVNARQPVIKEFSIPLVGGHRLGSTSGERWARVDKLLSGLPPALSPL